ncbi:MAG: radical SAM family heme chaperone HemW [Beijerinckiaceae bacterium]|nr:radical SAM family heme chaperone HemW [Beijerinckiaceae bacterium]
MVLDMQITDSGFGVYVHWPFCLSKCPYCDFNSHVRAQPIDEVRYIEAYRAEMAHRAAITGPRTVHSVFFGGGTPSLMKPRTIAALIDSIAKHWTLASDAEITLEANPTSIEAGRFAGYRTAGVNRVSVGVQALRDNDLKALGRTHTVAEAMAALDIAAANFDRYSFDLIYARPGQSPADWQAELEQACKRAAGHLSLYQLTIEPDTMFERLYRAGKLAMPDPDTGRAMWDVTQEVTQAHGLPVYEVSNHAAPGQESIHNLVYWRYGEYAGVGPGAHGRLNGRLAGGNRLLAQATERHPEMWLTAVQTEGHGIIEQETLTAEEQADEFLLMGLRLQEGIDPKRFESIRGAPLDAGRIADLLEHDMIEILENGRLRVSREGIAVLDAVVADLAA